MSSSSTTTTYLITGDVGGTNSRMSLYELGNQETPVVTKYYRNEEHLPEQVRGQPSAFLDHVLIPFLDHCWQTTPTLQPPSSDMVIMGCIASAGVVTDNRVNLTNLGNLLICGNMIEKNKSSPYMKRFVRCLIINDFVAQGYGCLTLKENEVQHLHGPQNFASATASGHGPKVCVGAGTGLGECYLTQSLHVASHDPYSCFPSEGGHVEYAPRNALEVELFEYLSTKFNSKHRISVERVVSGKGLANVYEFLAYKFPDMMVPAVHQKFLDAGDEQAKVVAQNAGPGTLCRQAMSILMSAYGCEVGSAAIKWIPTGGLFVTGGLTPKNMEFIRGHESDFMQSYLHKGRVAPVLERIPLYAVLVEDLGVRGAHKAALMAYENYCELHPSLVTKTSSYNMSSSFWTTVATAAVAGVGSAVAVLYLGRKK